MPSAKRPTILAVAGLASIALGVAGCGGSSDPGVAHLSSAKDPSSANAEGSSSSPESGAGTDQKMVAFAKCMRSHGVTNFPEPKEGNLELRSGPGGVNPGSAQFEAAQKACHNLLPEGGNPSPQHRKQAEEQALKFTACMRAHGDPNFPEPEFSGNRVKLGHGKIDMNSPQFRAAAEACRQNLLGGPKAGAGG